MTFNAEQFAAANKATVDSLLAVANAALASAERIAALNIETTRSVLEDSVGGAKAVLAAKDPKEAAAIQASLAQPALEKAVAYSRSLYDISVQAQGNLTQVVQAQFADFQKTVNDLLAQAAKNAPKGAEGPFGAVQGAVAAASSSFEQMNAVARQFADLAQANMAAASKAAESMTKGFRK